MTLLRKSQDGIAAIAILLLVAVIAVVGLVAYRVKSSIYNSNSSSSPSVAQVTAPKNIKSKTDIKQADQALQALPISKDLNPSQLDGNVQTLL